APRLGSVRDGRLGRRACAGFSSGVRALVAGPRDHRTTAASRTSSNSAGARRAGVPDPRSVDCASPVPRGGAHSRASVARLLVPGDSCDRRTYSEHPRVRFATLVSAWHSRTIRYARHVSLYSLNCYTRDILIEQGATAHSMPVLTLNGRFLDDDDRALSQYVHEQGH